MAIMENTSLMLVFFKYQGKTTFLELQEDNLSIAYAHCDSREWFTMILVASTMLLTPDMLDVVRQGLRIFKNDNGIYGYYILWDNWCEVTS